MDVPCFMLCESAVEQDGHVSLLKTFDVIRFPEFPAVGKCKSLVAVVRFGRTEGGPHQFRMMFMGEDGPIGLFYDLVVNLTVPPECANLTTLTHPFVVPLTEMKFSRPGDYEFHLLVDGARVAVAPLAVRHTLK